MKLNIKLPILIADIEAFKEFNNNIITQDIDLICCESLNTPLKFPVICTEIKQYRQGEFIYIDYIWLYYDDLKTYNELFQSKKEKNNIFKKLLDKIINICYIIIKDKKEVKREFKRV